MTQKFIVNGVSYDSLEAMPRDVREKYERAMEILKDVKQKTVENESLKKTVTNVPGGVKINVEQRSVRYNIDGKTYDDPAQLPPEIRVRIDESMSAGSKGDDVNVIEAHVSMKRRSGIPWLVVWFLIALAVVLMLV